MYASRSVYVCGGVGVGVLRVTGVRCGGRGKRGVANYSCRVLVSAIPQMSLNDFQVLAYD